MKLATIMLFGEVDKIEPIQTKNGLLNKIGVKVLTPYGEDYLEFWKNETTMEVGKKYVIEAEIYTKKGKFDGALLSISMRNYKEIIEEDIPF